MKDLPKLTFKNSRGIEYQIVWKVPARRWKANGLCDPPDSKTPEIWINPNLKEKLFLEVLCEEIIHSEWFEKPEKEVRKLESNLRRVLIKCGFRTG